MTTPEQKVKKACVEIIKKHGAYYFFPPANGYGISGLFDIIIIPNGWFLGVECKADRRKRPSPLQSRNAAKTIASGGCALLIHNENLDILDKTIESMKNAQARTGWTSVWPFDSVTQT